MRIFYVLVCTFAFLFSPVHSFYNSNTFLQLRRGSNQLPEISSERLKECSKVCKAQLSCFGFEIQQNGTNGVLCKVYTDGPNFLLTGTHDYFAKNIFNVGIRSFDPSIADDLHNQMNTADDYLEKLKEILNDCKCNSLPTFQANGLSGTYIGCPHWVFGKSQEPGFMTFRDPDAVRTIESWEQWGVRTICLKGHWYTIQTHPADSMLIHFTSVQYRNNTDHLCKNSILDPSLCRPDELCCSDAKCVRSAVIDRSTNDYVRGLIVIGKDVATDYYIRYKTAVGLEKDTSDQLLTNIDMLCTNRKWYLSGIEIASFAVIKRK